MIARLVDRMQEGRVPFLVFATISAVPVVMAMLLFSLLPLVVDLALVDVERRTVDVAIAGVRAVALAIVACGIVTACAAALVLRSFLRASVDRIRIATEAIAAGDFTHRIDSPRHDELGSLAAAIDGTAVRLERLERSRRQLLACVSHELRTPVTIVRSAAYTLARREDDPVRRERFELIDEELARLASLVDDLVEAASIHAGGVRLHRERIDVGELLADCAERFRGPSAERGITLRVSTAARRRPAIADLDVDRVQQVVGNLLANAIRHAAADSDIDLELTPAASEAEAHCIEVVNRGSVVPQAMHDRIFEPFQQHGDRCGRVGLGLAIARDLAEAHGGSLVLAEDGAHGAVRFRIELPSAPERSRGDRLRGERAAPSTARGPIRWPDQEFAT